MRVLLPCSLLLPCFAFATSARAYEDQVTLGAGAGYAHAASSALPRHGAIFDVSVSAGLDPVWSVRGHASYAVHPGDEAAHALLLGADLLYLIDVVEIVPYFGAGAGGIARIHRGDSQLDATVQLVVGVDYLISRELALELEARPYLLVTELDGEPFYGSLAAAVVVMFDG